MATQRGICPVCDREYGVTKAGGMRDHWSAPALRRQGNWTCPGVGQPPKSTVADPIAAAEQCGYQRAIEALRGREVWLPDDPGDEFGSGQFVVLTAAARYLEALATQPTDTTEQT